MSALKLLNEARHAYAKVRRGNLPAIVYLNDEAHDQLTAEAGPTTYYCATNGMEGARLTSVFGMHVRPLMPLGYACVPVGLIFML